MLSKLLSNIANNENASLPEGFSDKIKNGEGEKGPQQVFKSLLKAMQNDQSAGNQQLLHLDNTDNETEGENGSVQLKGMGGIFTQTDTDEVAVNEQQSAQSILKRLQQQLKNESPDTDETSDTEEQKIAGDQSAEASVGSSSNKKSTVDTKKNRLPQKDHENSEVDDRNKEVDNATNQLKPVNEIQQQAEGSDEPKKADEQLKVKLVGETNNTDSADQQYSRQLDETSDSKENQSSSDHKEQTEGSTKKTDKTEIKATAEPSSGKNIQAVNEQKTTDVADSDEKNEEGRTQTGAASSNSEQKIEELVDDDGKTSSDSKQHQKVAAPQSEKEQGYSKKETEQKVDDRKGKESQQLNGDPKEQSDEKRTTFLNNSMDQNLQRSDEISIKGGEAAATDTNNQNEQNKQQPLNETIGAKSAKTELNVRQKKFFNSFLRNDNTIGLSDKGFERKNTTTEKDRRKTKENAENSEKGISSYKSSDQLLSRLGILNTENSKQIRPIDIQSIQGISTGDSQMNTEEQKIWDEHTAENVEADDEKGTKTSSSSSSIRLSQIPVANASLRQKMLPRLTQSVKKAAAEAKKSPGNWQKHNFVLDDGKKIQLSVRESKGVLQVKMGSMNSDLSKLLQQNLQQIREHLKQEFDSDIDLQFEGHDQSEEESAFSEGSKSSDQQRNYRNTVSGNEVPTEGTGDLASSTVRNFGYNQMEWTA